MRCYVLQQPRQVEKMDKWESICIVGCVIAIFGFGALEHIKDKELQAECMRAIATTGKGDVKDCKK